MSSQSLPFRPYSITAKLAGAHQMEPAFSSPEALYDFTRFIAAHHLHLLIFDKGVELVSSCDFFSDELC